MQKVNRWGRYSLIGSIVGLWAVAIPLRPYLNFTLPFGIHLRLLLEAFFEAALVGGCADWFAVTALFRHPFGLSFLPHTRIIVSKKPEIAAGLSEVVKTLLTPDAIRVQLQDVHLGHKLIRLIEQGRETGVFSNLIRDLSPPFLNELRKGAILEPVNFSIVEYLETEVNYCEIAASLMTLTKRSRTHKRVAHFFGEQLLDLMTRRREFISKEIWRTFFQGSDGTASKTAPLKSWIRRSVFKHAVSVSEVEEMIGNMAEGLRNELAMGGVLSDALVEIYDGLLSRLENDPEYAEVLNSQIRKIIKDADLPSIARAVNEWIADYMETEITKGSMDQFRVMSDLISRVIESLKGNSEALEALDSLIKKVIITLVSSENLIEWVGEVAATQMNNMPDETFVSFIYDKVGNDLQYIRLNGAIVGGTVGSIIYCIKAM